MNADGSGRTKLIDAGSCYCLGRGRPGLAWSPDGAQIAFMTLDYKGKATGRDVGLYVMKADGSAPRLLTDLQGVSGSPAWQPVP